MPASRSRSPRRSARGDALGFDRTRRRTLTAAGVAFVAGAALGVVGLLASSFVATAVALLVVVLGVFGVCVVLAWRLGEAAWDRAGGVDWTE